jgi:hypothetical protein
MAQNSSFLCKEPIFLTEENKSPFVFLPMGALRYDDAVHTQHLALTFHRQFHEGGAGRIHLWNAKEEVFHNNAKSMMYGLDSISSLFNVLIKMPIT